MKLLLSFIVILFLSLTGQVSAAQCTEASAAGFVGDGITPNDAALIAWASTFTTSGGCLIAGQGKFRLNQSHNIVIPNPSPGPNNTTAVSTITIDGAGADLTTFYFPNGNGLTFSYSSSQHAVHLSGFSITSGTEGGGTAIKFTNSYEFFGTFVAQSDIVGVTCRGDDGYALIKYWGTCVEVNNVSDVNFDNDNFYATSGGLLGTGIVFDNPGNGCFVTPITCGTIYNIDSSNFSFIGLAIRLGANTQTLAVDKTLFAQTETGIFIPANAGTLQGLMVTNSTFFVLGHSIVGLTSVPNLFITSNMFGVPPGYYGVSVLSSNATIVGNQFIPRETPNSAAGGISVSPGPIGDLMVISANTFSSVGQAIYLKTGTTGITVDAGNAYTGNTGDILNGGGVANTVPVTCAGHPGTSFKAVRGMVTQC